MSATHPRGTTNSNDRGGAADRRARKLWLLATFDVDLGPALARCALRVHENCAGTVTYETMQVDRIVSKLKGGRYTRDNIQPACGPCNHRKGTEEREAHHRLTCAGRCTRCRKVLEYRLAREAEELAREQVTAGYATESEQYGPLLSFRDYLEQTRGEQ